MQKKLFATTEREHAEERYAELDRVFYAQELDDDQLANVAGLLTFEPEAGKYVFVCPDNRSLVGEYLLLHSKLYLPNAKFLPYLSSGWNLLYWKRTYYSNGPDAHDIAAISNFDLVSYLINTISTIPTEAPDDQAVSS